jgi:hypothetical protein
MRLETKNGGKNFGNRNCSIGTSVIIEMYKTGGWINRKM